MTNYAIMSAAAIADIMAFGAYLDALIGEFTPILIGVVREVINWAGGFVVCRVGESRGSEGCKTLSGYRATLPNPQMPHPRCGRALF